MFKRNSIFFRFAMYYTCIVVLMIVIGAVAYRETYNIVRKSAIGNILVSLEKGKNITDERMKEVEKNINLLSAEKEIASLYGLPAEPNVKDYYSLLNAFNTIKSYNLNNSFIEDFYLVLKDQNILLSSRYISDNTKNFYGTFLSYDGLDYNSWYEKILGKYYYKAFIPTQRVNNNNVEKEVITYIQSIPVGSTMGYKGVITALIDKNKFFSYFDNEDIKNGGLAVINSKNDIITSYSIPADYISAINMSFNKNKGYYETTISNSKVMVIYAKSDWLDWTYVSFLPTSLISRKIENIKQLFMLAALFAFIAGIASVLFLSYKSSKPINEIKDNLRELYISQNENTEGDYKFIKEKISEVINNNKYLKVEIENNKIVMQVGFWERILRGNFSDLEELEQDIKYIGIPKTDKDFMVMIIKINEEQTNLNAQADENLDILRFLSNKRLKEDLGEGAYLHNFDRDKTAVILFIEKQFEENYEEVIERVGKYIINFFSQEYNVSVRLGIGCKYSNFYDLSTSFTEAGKSLDYKAISKDKAIVWYKDIPKTNVGYYYPEEVESKLIKLTRMGEKNELLILLNSIYTTNFQEFKLSENDFNQFIYHVQGTLMRIKQIILINEGNQLMEVVDNKINTLRNYVYGEEIYQQIINLFIYYCEFINGNKKSNNVELKKELIEYVNLNYHKDDLYLSNIAEVFNLNENYLSQFFKEQCGENFSTYLEKIRIKNAVELLDNEEISVSEVVKRVGYANSNTFYKAFKRIYGVSPSSYRKNNT